MYSLPQKKIVNVLGTAKVVMGAIAPAIIENSNCQVLIATTHDSYNGINKCILDGNIHMEYPIMYADDSQKSLDSFLHKMKDNNIRVGIININSPLFSQMIEEGNGGIWFSACRDGFILKYLPILEKKITQTTNICSFDNDKSIVEDAKSLYNNPEIRLHKCIIHSVCSAVRFDYKEQTVYVECGKECQLFFPPETVSFKIIGKIRLSL